MSHPKPEIRAAIVLDVIRHHLHGLPEPDRRAYVDHLVNGLAHAIVEADLDPEAVSVYPLPDRVDLRAICGPHVN